MNRGERLTYAIKISGLSRRKFARVSEVSEHTLRAWESNGDKKITEKNIDRIVNALLKAQILSDKNWILFGIGQPPISMYYISDQQNTEISRNNIDLIAEVEQFRSMKDRLVLLLDDDFFPFFYKKHYVGGDVIDFTGEINGKLCLVKSKTNEIYIGFVLIQDYLNMVINLYGLKKNMSLYIIAKNLNICKIAPISYHRM